jgi:hypothetical protein
MNVKDRSVVRAIRGPVTLITLGVLFAFNNFTAYGFEQTWPVLLIVFGLLSLLGRGTEPPPQPPPPPYPSSTQGYPPPPAGGYRQTTYSQTNDPGNSPGGQR